MDAKTKTTYTPGPWDSKRAKDEMGRCSRNTIIFSGQQLICSIKYPGNARLIAAAPELLQFAKATLVKLEQQDEDGNYMDVPSGYGPGMSLIGFCKMVIAKAEGK